MRNTTKGFTLIELIVVILIVIILAAISMFLVGRTLMKKAVMEEAIVAMHVIRIAEEAYHRKNGIYLSADRDGGIGDLPGVQGRQGPFGTGDLDGTYWSEEVYEVDVNGNDPNNNYEVKCFLINYMGGLGTQGNSAPKREYVRRYVGTSGYFSMYSDGTIDESNIIP